MSRLLSSSHAARSHVAHVYDETPALITRVGNELGAALARDEAIVILATPEHRNAFAAHLSVIGIDIDHVRAAGTCVELDAAETLAVISDGSQLDRGSFFRTIGDILRTASGFRRSVTAYGELVALLWERGDIVEAMVLELWWNELGLRHDFNLHCGYRLNSVFDAGDLTAVTALCRNHTEVVAPGTYAAPPTALDPDPRQHSAVFLPVPSSVSSVRHLVTATLGVWGLEGRTDHATLVASELATNAIRHTDTAFELTIRADDGRVRLEVRDGRRGTPEPANPDASSTGGRGLAIVARVAAASGIDAHRDGKIVWAELAVS